jgi:hypothetical protein
MANGYGWLLYVFVHLRVCMNMYDRSPNVKSNVNHFNHLRNKGVEKSMSIIIFFDWLFYTTYNLYVQLKS